MRKNYTKQTGIHAFLLWTITIMCFSALFLSSCSEDEEPAPTEDIIGILENTDGLDSLIKLIELKNASGNPVFPTLGTELLRTNRTFFAPNNTAFANLVNAVGVNGMTELRTDLVQNILLYHMVTGTAALRSNQLTDAMETELDDETLSTTTDGDKVTLNATTQTSLLPSIVTPNLRATNGIVHVIDNLALPASITDDVLPTFGTLAGFFSMVNRFSQMDLLIRKAGFRDELADNTAQYTVLGLFDNLIGSVANVTEEQARVFIGYHIIVGNPFDGTILPDEVPTLLPNDPIYVASSDIDPAISIQLNYSAFLYDFGFKALSNGKVYIPVAINSSNQLDLTALSSSLLRNTAIAYIETFKDVDLGLVNEAVALAPSAKGILEGDAPYTFFVPNDSAFAAAGITSDTLKFMPVAEIEAILKNHIITGSILFLKDLSGTTATTAAGSTLSFAESGNNIIVTNSTTSKTATIVFPNYLTNVGVVHDVNKLLAP